MVDRDSIINDDMVGMLHDAMGMPHMELSDSENYPMETDYGEGPNPETSKFLKLLQDAESPLYPYWKKFTALSFIVQLLHLKVMCGWTDKSFTLLLQLLKKAFPNDVKLPNSYYEANKITVDLGFTYKTWDACPNNCMLFKDEDEKLGRCSICETSRYKQFDVDPNGAQGKRVPAKQVRYFPLVPRLQRFFMSSKTASLMKWHAEGRIDDGVLRHLANSPAWKSFDEKYPNFASDSRNVRLGLAADGFNPFRTMSISHSIWPYNLPPRMCMKQPFFILTILIDGPKAPGNKIDVFLQPLINELKELWHEGVPTYDASSNHMFKLHATLMWTISDFPVYANLSSSEQVLHILII